MRARIRPFGRQPPVEQFVQHPFSDCDSNTSLLLFPSSKTANANPKRKDQLAPDLKKLTENRSLLPHSAIRSKERRTDDPKRMYLQQKPNVRNSFHNDGDQENDDDAQDDDVTAGRNTRKKKQQLPRERTAAGRRKPRDSSLPPELPGLNLRTWPARLSA